MELDWRAMSHKTVREGSSEEVTLELYLLQTISTFRQLDALLLQAKALRVLQHLNWASCSPCHPCPHRSPSRDHYFFFLSASQGLWDLSSWTRDRTLAPDRENA